MRCKPFPFAAALVIAAIVSLPGCGLLTPDEGPTVEYRDAESTKSLEVPPDLTRPESTGSLSVDDTGSGGSLVASTGDGTGMSGSGDAAASGVLPEFEGIRFVRAGASSWLEVDDVAPDRVWPRIERFLRDQGLDIARSEPRIGVIETDWAARYDGPESGGLTGFFNNALGGMGSDNIRDRYNVRLERMDGGGTRIFVAHQSAQEIDTEGNTRKEANFEWVRRGGDPAVEAEMARRLLVYLGVSKARSGTIVANASEPEEGAVRYQLKDGVADVLVKDRDPKRVFARVGDALARIGAEVRSAERERGVYAFDWRPPKGSVDDGGFFGWFGDDEPERRSLQLRLRPVSDGMRIKAANEDGEPRSGQVHRTLLRELAVAMGADESLVRDTEESATEEGGGGPGTYNEPERPPM